MTIGKNALYFRDYMVAIGYFNKVLELRPWMAEPYFLRGYAKMMLEDFAGAKYDSSLALEKNAYLGQAYLIRAIAHHSLKEYEKASQDYRKALQLNPDDAGVRFNLAGTLYEQKKYHQADSLAKLIPPKTKVYPLSLLLQGDIALKDGDTISAKLYAQKALKADTTLAQGYAFQADIMRMQEKIPEAIKLLDKAINYAPENEALYVNRGLMNYLSNNYQKAIEDYNQAILLDPQNKTAYYNRALLRSFLGDLNKALADFEWVLDRDPSNDLAKFNAGILLTRLGNASKAIKLLSEILQKYPDFLPGYYARSDAYRQLGKLADSDKDQYKAYSLQKQGRKKEFSKDTQKKKSKQKPTRTEEEKALDAYQSLIASDDNRLGKEATMPESLRGRIQDRTASIAPMGFYYLSFLIPEKLLANCKFDPQISLFNEHRLGQDILCSTAQNIPLDSLQNSKALRELEALNSKVIPSPYYYLSRALYKYALVDLEDALADIQRALELEAQFPLALFARAFTQMRLIDLSLAEKEEKEKLPSVSILGKSSPQEESSTTLHSKKNKSYYLYREVEKDLDSLLEQFPNMAIALYNRAILFEKRGDKEKAIEYYSRLLRLNNAPQEAYFNRALLYLSLGKRQEAIQDLSKAGEKGIYQAYSILKRIQ